MEYERLRERPFFGKLKFHLERGIFDLVGLQEVSCILGLVVNSKSHNLNLSYETTTPRKLRAKNSARFLPVGSH